jgi:predicted ATPase
VLLDNAEGLAADRTALATLAGLVAATPQLRWLVTSREPLALAAEYCVPLGGLPADRPDDEAAALFRAQAERHGYRAEADDAAAIMGIARAVDGMPLALELAAQWLHAMTPAEIAAAIEDDLGFLHSDAADRKPGHRSLRAVFDSSWRRLAPAAQQALAALTVCRGSFDAAAARAVAGSDRALLLQLAGRSLIQRVDAGRFRLHTLMAQFSAEHLDGEAQQRARQRHMRHYLRLLAERDDLAIGRHAGVALRALGNDLDNLRGAWLQAVAQGEWDLLRRALDPADVLLGQLRRYAEAAEGFGRAADACPPSHPLRTRARIAQALAVISSGDLDAGSALLDALDRATLPPAEQADLANGRAMIASMRGEKASALAHCAAALAAARAAGAAALEAQAELNLAVKLWANGDLVDSEAHAVRAIALAERLGADLIRARTQRTLSVLRKEQRRLDESQQLLERSTAFFESANEAYDVAYNLRVLSLLMIDRGDVGAQLDYARRSLAAFEALGLPVQIAQSEFVLGLAQVACGDGAAATTTLRRCLRRALRLDVPMVARRALAELAGLAAAGDRALALRVLRFVAAHPAPRAADRPEILRHLDALAPSAEELAAADAALAGATLETIAAQVLAAD